VCSSDLTFFWDHFSPDKELAQARAMAEAAKQAGVAHAIWSTLEDTRKSVPLDDDRMPTLMGRFKVPHFDAKGEANALFTAAGVPTTFLLTSFYWDNFIHFGMQPKRGADGRLALALPIGDAKLAGIAAEDIGRCAYGIFKRGGPLAGQTIGIAGDQLTGDEMAAVFTRAFGEPVGYQSVPPEVYRSLGCSNRVYDYNACFQPVDPPTVKRRQVDLDSTHRLYVLEPPVGTVTQRRRTITETSCLRSGRPPRHRGRFSPRRRAGC
jgi:uncharacterized protein YbjT (DUF2867 family)